MMSDNGQYHNQRKDDWETPELSDKEPKFPQREPVSAPDKPEIFPTFWDKLGYRWRRIRRISTWEGKLFYGAISTLSTYFLGINIAPYLTLEPIIMSESIDVSNMEMIIWSVLIACAGIGSWITAKYKQAAKFKPAIKELKEVLEWAKSARDKASEGGSKITKAELAEGLDEMADTLEEVLLIFNIDIDINQDGK